MKPVKTALTTLLMCSALAMPVVAEDKPTADSVLATVNGTQITLGHVVALVERLPQQYQQVDNQTLFDGVLDQLIQQTLLSAQADASSRRIAVSRENEERAMLASVAIDQLVADKVTEEALQAAFDAQYGEQELELQFDASHILVETEEEAKAIIEELNGGADFAEVAKEKSTGPSGANGGNLGWFGKGAMVPAFEAAVLELEEGAISEPVKTQFGWHIVKLNGSREQAPLSFDDVRDELSNQLRGETIEGEINRLESEAEIVRNGAGIDVDLIRDSSLID